jgi:hydrophobic/amphiphilic exporter-1 (mainly G- bacteria), HAE1 family
MYWLAEICVKRPVFALMLIAALVVAGVVAFPSLGVDRYPSMDLPTIYVRAAYPGAASVEVEAEVSQVIEDAVATVAGIEELRSISSDGSCFVLVTFNLNRNLDAAVQDVRDAVASIVNRLPPGVDPPVVQKQDTDSSPVMSLAVSGPRTAPELFMLADRYVKNVIESSPGVGQVTIAGSADRAVQVRVDARRLAAHQMSILQVREALQRQNVEVPGGRVDEGMRERALRTLGRVTHARDFPDLVVASGNGGAVRLSDLGEVHDATKEVRTMARLNGVPAVVLQVQRQSGENTVRVIEAVKQRLPRSRALLPEDVEVTVIQDQSRYILAALHEIEGHLISGSILACLTVLLFMRSWRSTLIAAVAIPTSIIATFAFMKLFGFTLNNVTMLALVLMVGVVIDDAIVVLENVFRCIEEEGLEPHQAAIVGTREIGLAVLATTISLVIVFLPVSFLSSVTGRMLFQFGVTATVAILISMFVSFTLTPMMCSRLLKPHAPGAQPGKPGRPGQPAAQAEDRVRSRGGFYSYLERGYLALLKVSLAYRPLVLLLVVGVIASNFWLYQWVQQDYIPTNVDESEFEVSLNAGEGTSLIAMNECMQQAETRIRETPGVALTLTTVGTRGFGGVNRGDVFVRLQDIDQRTFSFERLWAGLWQADPGAAFRGNFSQRDKMDEIRKHLKTIPGVRASVRNLTSLRQGAPVDIDFSITGTDVEELAEFSEKLRQKAIEIDGIVDVDTTLRLDKPELLARIDRERAAALGIDAQEIADTLRIAVGGDDRVSRYRDLTVDDAYDVELRLVGVDRRDVESISQLYVRARPNLASDSWVGGAGAASAAGMLPGPLPAAGSVAMTRIDNVVGFETANSIARIDRLDRQRMVALRANVASGYALSDRIAALQAAAEEIGLPPGFETRVLGRGRELERTLSDFVWTFALSFVFMYIVLAAQYEHLVHPFTILLSLPLAVPFGLISLYWGGESLNLYSALGILVLFGVVKKAAILQIDHTNALRARGLERTEATLRANRDRLRPILMTTISFVAGLMPLLVATGPGAEERRSIAVLVVGGQTLSLLLTLLAVPVMYTYLDDLGSGFQRGSQWLARIGSRRPRPISPAAAPQPVATQGRSDPSAASPAAGA